MQREFCKAILQSQLMRNCFSCLYLYILNTVRCPYVDNIRTSVTVGVASSVANDVIMRAGAANTRMMS